MTPAGLPPRPPLAPRWALRLLLHPDDRQVALSELAEHYELRRVRDGERQAASWYRRQLRQYPVRLLVARLKGQAMSTTAASRAARRRYGAGESLGALVGEVRRSVRGLRKAAGLTTTVTLILALGIGATTTVFGIVSSVLLQPLPYPDPERLVRIYRDHPPNRWPLSVVDYEALRDQQTHFERVAAYRERLLTFHRGEVVERIAGQQVTPG